MASRPIAPNDRSWDPMWTSTSKPSTRRTHGSTCPRCWPGFEDLPASDALRWSVFSRTSIPAPSISHDRFGQQGFPSSWEASTCPGAFPCWTAVRSVSMHVATWASPCLPARSRAGWRSCCAMPPPADWHPSTTSCGTCRTCGARPCRFCRSDTSREPSA